ncbi:protein NUCLEAR FUSION DEFECTIVE 4-like [Telopea speciosissima]|uniref:protein NUCLEAR FUSION DEFECTIVE 4-like n=1 Tax=Telopea speciosissima TaxID=54955 RepID=UPI001CC58EB3|nr:protein NUCLEAR FUSION DEFECTIVE 4-like [Telopea speciosissima]
MFPSNPQWLILVGTIWLQSIAGTNSDFPAYSSELKHLLSISQVQLNNLAFASDAGKLFGLFSGISAVYLPLSLVLMIGSTIGFIGYGLQFLIIVNKISPISYWKFFMLSVFSGNSICWINTVSYVVIIKNFSSNHQAAVGLSTSYVGLSAKIYTDIVDAVFPSSRIKRAKAYLLLNSILPMVVSMVTAPLVREVKNGEGCRVEEGFIVIFFITIATGVYAVLGSISILSSIFSPLIRVICMGFLLASPLFVPVVTRIKEEGRVSHLAESVDDVMKGGERIEEDCVLRMQEEIGAKVMIRKVEFWLYFFVYMFGATLGLVFSNNLGQIAESRGHSKTSLVSLSSSFVFFGRLLPSLLDYFLSNTGYMVSRSASIVTLMVPMAGAFFLLLNTTYLTLYISTCIISICTGAITSIAVSTTTELFGKKNLQVNHNIVVANIPLGSFIFGYLAAILYQRGGDGDGRCMGFECYRRTFIIWGSVCSLGTVLAFILYIRTTKTSLLNRTTLI